MALTSGLFTSVMPLGSDANTSTIGWGLIIFAIVGGVLWFSLYGALEKLIAFLVCGFSLSVVVALLLLIFSPNPEYPLTMADVRKGMTFSLGDPAERQVVNLAAGKEPGEGVVDVGPIEPVGLGLVGDLVLGRIVAWLPSKKG